MKNKTVILVAVRLKSQRLKKKALLKLYKKPLIMQLTDRIKKSHLSSEVIWCTSINRGDDELERLGKKNKIKVFRGSEKDVMSRFILAAQKFGTKNIVRVTGDNPLTDPEVIDFLIKKHIKNKNDYTCCNSIPIGTRSEVINLQMLKRCHQLLEDPNSSEYMTWMLDRPDYFKTQDVVFPKKKINRSKISLTIDSHNDYKNISLIYNHFKEKIPSLEKIIEWIDTQPKLRSKLTRIKKNKKISKKINFKFKSDY